MPPKYGIDSIYNRDFYSEDGPGYFDSNYTEMYDPAFGEMNYETVYGPAPFTGNIPLTSYYNRPALDYGFFGDLTNPSFGGASNPRYNQFKPEDVATGIMQQAPTIPMGIFTDDAGLEEESYEEFPEVKQEPRGIAKLFEVLGNIPTPFNLARRGLESLQGFNQRLRNTDFGRSATLKDYFQARRDRKAREEAAARGAAKASERAMERSVQESGRGFGGDTSGQRAGGGGFGGNTAGGFSEEDPSATEGSF